MSPESRVQSPESARETSVAVHSRLSTLDSRLQTPDSRLGFTLVEAVVAAVLVAIGVVGALGAIGAAARAQAAAGFYHDTALLAQEKMAELEAAPSLEAGEKKGDFGEAHPGYEWKTQVEPLTGEEEWTKHLWKVRVGVSRPETGPRRAEVVTYLLKR